MSRILRFFALVAVVFFSVNAFAGDPYGSCSAKKVYTDCAKGYVLQNGECVLDASGSCSAGKYWNGSECAGCPSTHPNSAAGASSESECFKTAELMKNGGSGTCFGKTGTYDGSITCYYGSTCALPSWNSSSCNMTNGSKIFKGWSLSDDATTGTTGDFVHGNTYYAVWVTPSCNITNGSGVATTASSNKPRCTVTCNSGYGTSGTYTGSAGATSVSYTCTLASDTCSEGQYWNGSACQECTSGYYCPGGTWTGTAVQGRESCPAGYGNSAPGSVDESDCYLTTTAGKYVATPKSAETTCAENGYCPGGIDVYYGDTDGRMACTANSSSDAGSDAISDCKCNAGYGGNAGVTGGTCTICSAGTYKTSSGNTSCSACTAGYYCTGGTNQTACTANSSSAAGSDAISDCKCNAGYGGNAGVTNGTCTICAAGKYKTSSGNTSCSTCTAGYYCTGGTNRTACAANSSSSAGSDAISDCQCNAGYGGNAGVTNGTCTICAAGTYKTSSGNSSCSTCTEGYYCTGGTNNQTACPTGYGNSAPGSDAQSDCYMIVPAGSYLPTAGSTTTYTCPRGASSGQHEVYYGNTSQCSSCAPGSYTPYDGATCSVCPAGSYCTGDGNATKCPPLYTNSSAGSDAITDCYTNTLTGQYIATARAEVVTDCQAGTSAGAHTVYYGATSQCNVCKANQWSGDAAGSCQTCPSGWTNDGATAADHAYVSSCKHTVVAGNWYDSVNSTFNMCADGTYSEEHLAGYGVSTSCESCNTGYTNNSNHTACVAICYKITLDNTTNGGTGGTTVLYKPHGSSLWYSDSSCSTQVTTITKPTKTNAVYSGHYTSASSSGYQYIESSGSLLSKTVTGPITLYARYDCDTNWRGSGTNISGACTGTQSTVSFDANGGTGGQTADVTATYGSEMPEISTTKPTRTGYYFVGWYDAQTGGTQYYIYNGTSARTWNKTTGATLYAHWSPNTPTIMLYPASATTSGTTKLYAIYGTNVYLDISHSQAMTTSANPITKPTKTGYTFAGYYSESDSTGNGTGTEYIDANGYITSAGLSAGKECASTYCEWYARWTVNTYTVSFDANGGTGGQTASVTATYGSQMPTISTTKPTRTGYTFQGWYDAQTGGTKYYNASGTSARTWNKAENTTLYAQWTVNNYTIRLNSGSGTRYLHTTYDTNVYLDSSRSQAMTTNANPITKPTSDGYTFAGYYSESDGTGTEYIDANGYITSAGLSAGKECTSDAGCIWYVKWTANTYTVSFDANGGTGVLPDPVTATYGSQMPTLTTPAPTRTGYHFNGWYDAQTGGTMYYNIGGTTAHWWDKTENTTLYAQWAVRTYVCTSGQYLNITSCERCTAGYYCPSSSVRYTYNGSVQGRTPCGDGKYSSAGATSCSNISAGCYGTSASSSCPAECAAGTYAPAGSASCSACTGRTKYSAAKAGSCSTVSSGYYTTGCNTSGNNCTGQSQCTSGTYCTGGEQKTCPSGYGASAAGSDAAADCYMSVAATKYVKTAKDASATACGTGTYKEAHTVYYGGTSTCNSCPSGYDDGAAASAESGCKISVAGGKYVGTENSATLSTCSAGYYKAAHSVAYGSTSSCSACGAVNKYSSSGASSCSTVSTGYYTTGGTTTTRTGQSQCTSGTYCTGGEQKTCPSGYGASAAGSDAASDCYMSVAATKYVKTAKDASATACGTGTYKAAHTVYYGGTSTCNSCPTGYDDGAAASAESGCKISVAGGKYVGTENSATLSTCAGGTYKAAHSVAYGSTSSCETCGAGYYCPEGASSQTACGGNTKYSSSGATACSTVSSGYYSTGGTSTTRTGQTKCEAGNYCSGGVKTACGGGKYSAAGATSCSNITAGCYGTSASSSCPAVCAANTYSNAGASSCSSCPTDYKNSGNTAASHAGSASCIITVSGGYYIGTAGDNSSNWDKCACGTYKASHTVAYGSTSSCATTDAGYYAAAGASSQTKATAGYYAAAGACSQTACSGRTKYSAAGAASCSTVSTGYYTTGCNSSSNACTSQTICAKGTYCSSGVAYNCPGGTYGSTTGLSTNACSGKCTAGYYCPAGSTSATQNACATNATSAAGSDAISDCVCKAGYSGDASTSSGTCTACACGYYKGSTGNTSCTKTTAGYYATGTGNTGQTKATAGNYAAAGACSQSSCADLGGGLYSSSAAGSDATDDCYATVPATKYLSSSTSTSFTTCTAGYYCPGKTLYYASTGGRTACGGGKYSEEGSDASSDCKSISAGCYGSSAGSACPNTCAPGSYSTGGASGCTICGNKPTNSSYTDATGNTSADCPWTCNDGYNQTSDNQCGQFCTAGITHIKSSNGLSVPLYSSARTSPAINVKVNNSVCYGSLATGQSSGALNVKVGSTTYHSIN